MKAGWKQKRLREITTKIGSGATPRGGDESYKVEGISLIRSLNVYDEGFRLERLARIDDEQAARLSNVVVEPNDVLLNITGASVARCCRAPVELLPARVNQHVAIIRPLQDEIGSAFLHYLLISEGYKQRLLHAGEEGGSTRQAITKAELQEFAIDYPESLAEQQQIVAILDEAFEAIATAKANAENNLQNARALFESHLRSAFGRSAGGWESRTLGEIAQVKGGKRVPKGYKLQSEPTDYPYIRVTDFNDQGSIDLANLRYVSAEIHHAIRNYIIRSSDLYVSIAGTIGKTGIVPEELDGANLTENACRLVFRPEINNRFVYYFTLTADFVAQAGLNTRTAAQPKLALSRLSTIALGIPNRAEQDRLVDEFDELQEETQRLAAIYTRKLDALEELKKSLLHQAFTGQLTANFRETVSIPFPAVLPGISITDLHAGILAMAYRTHERGNKLDHLTKVKVEKISHMIEAWAGIELGRKPVKDYFGPNDTKHLKGVEHRAKMTKSFSFHKDSDGGERIRKLENFDTLLAKTEAALGERQHAVQELLTLMLPMSYQQAEIFTTVHAAWNNLLLTGQEATDEAIVTEARENWHPEKLKIERQKFFRAIEWIREKNLVPQGRGKLVGAKPK